MCGIRVLQLILTSAFVGRGFLLSVKIGHLNDSEKKCIYFKKKCKNILRSKYKVRPLIYQKHTTMTKTTSYKHYLELKAKGMAVELVTKQDLNPYKK
jgi:tRNA G18 (ribose-2'-O)-methylase SpoU